MNSANGEKFFSPDDLARIRAAVAAAELRTAGEIATMVVAASDSYREAVMLGGIFLSGFMALLIAVASHHVTIWSYIPLVMLLFFPCTMLMSAVPRLKLMFMTRRRIVEVVRERAVRAFFEKGLYRTRDETGILIFISLLERKVWILGDRGINARIAPGTWGRFASLAAQGLREGKGAEALCQVIGECGQELARHFPRQSDDVNELSDDLIRT
jgi:putative membrane protein